jgi:hypothetical protein
MAQAIAIKRYGWSPEGAAQLTASDMKMVESGFTAEETYKARKEQARQRAEDNRLRIEAQERENQARIDERKFEAGQRSLDRRAAAGNKPISDRVELQTQGPQEMLEAAQTMDDLADKIGYGDVAFNASAANREYGNAVTKAAQAEAKAVHGGPSGTAAQEFRKNYLNPLDPRATAAQVRAQARDLRERAMQRARAMNEGFENQGKRGPIPGAVLQRGQAGGASAGAPTHYRYNRDRTLRIPTDAAGNPVGNPEPVR